MVFDLNKFIMMFLICKKIFLYLLIGLFLVSCGPCDGCESFYTYYVGVKNESTENFKILFYNSIVADPISGYAPFLREEVVVSSGNVVIKEHKDTSNPPHYYSFANIFCDSIVLKFNNGKGYYTTLKYTEIQPEIRVDYWMENKSSFFGIDPNDLTDIDGILIYTITQEDYENAHELP